MDLLLRVLLIGGAVHRVVKDVGGKAGSQRIWGFLLCFVGVCGAHHGSPVLHSIFFSQEEHQTRPAGKHNDRVFI